MDPYTTNPDSNIHPVWSNSFGSVDPELLYN